MNIFCSYAYTGEDLAIVSKRMETVVDALTKAGHNAYCDRFDAVINKLSDEGKVLELLKTDFATVKENNALLALLTSPKLSAGSLMEIGVAISNNIPVYIFEHSSANGTNYLPKLAKANYIFNDDSELKRLLQQFKP